MNADTGPQTRVVGGRYAIGRMLGKGGMGTVWLATDQVLGRQVAVKEVTFSIHVTDEERAVLRERTMREARAAARLEHPHVTTVYDVVEEDGKPWLVMKHVAARSLQDLLEEHGPLPPDAVARIGLDVLDALEAAHEIGIVHRDVKPANVLVARDGRASLTDFGIATSTGDSSLTTQGALIGSPSYMAPERAHGEEPRPPVDLWSLGATLYAAVEGRAPFDRGEAVATLMSVVSEPPAPMLRAGPLEPVLRLLLTKDPARRGTAATVRPQLQAVVAGRPPNPSETPSPQPPPPRPAPPQQSPVGVPHNSLERIDSEDLRKLASASKALLGSVARDARDVLAERRRERKAEERKAEERKGDERKADDRRADVRKADVRKADVRKADVRKADDRKGGRRAGGREPAARPVPAPVADARPRSWRFKRRWVVVPVLTTVLVVMVLLVGAGLALAAVFGML